MIRFLSMVALTFFASALTLGMTFFGVLGYRLAWSM